MLCRRCVAVGALPALPLAPELLYAVSTTVLLHFGVYDPYSLTPNYKKFTSDVSGKRWGRNQGGAEKSKMCIKSEK